MQKKTIYIFLAIFVGLLIFVEFDQIKSFLGIKEKAPVSSEINLSFFTEKNITAMTIKQPSNDEIKITKDGDNWKVNGFLAATDVVNNFITGFKDAKLVDLVSKNKDNHASFDITDEKGTILTLEAGSNKKVYIIGKPGNGYTLFYIRAKDSNNVYNYNGSIRNTVSLPILSWRDKSITTIENANIKKIKVENDKSFTLDKSAENKWQKTAVVNKKSSTTGAEDANATKALNVFTSLQADDFLNESETKEFKDAKGKSKITITLTNDKEVIFQLYKKDEQFWLNSNQKTDSIFKISTSKLDDLMNI